MLSISVIFLVITLIIYVCEDSLKTSGLFHKITIAFILNLTICFIVVIDNFLQDLKEDRRETVLCKLSGYGVMYFFLSFFFWINTMSFSIYLKFTNMSVHSPSKSSERKKLMYYSLYAQGVPLLIVIITMSIDSSVIRKELKPEDLIHYPNMGIYSCFLGAIKTASHQIYFGRPEFIYFQSFLLLIQISNLIFLGLTVKYLLEGFRNKAKLTKTKTGGGESLWEKFTRLKEQFGVIFKLFIIMGVPWIFELVTSVIAAESGYDKTCGIRLVLDLANLLAGILIFLVTVSNKTVYSSLKSKATELTSGIYTGSEDRKTRATNIEMSSTGGESSKML